MFKENGGPESLPQWVTLAALRVYTVLTVSAHPGGHIKNIDARCVAEHGFRNRWADTHGVFVFFGGVHAVVEWGSWPLPQILTTRKHHRKEGGHHCAP